MLQTIFVTLMHESCHFDMLKLLTSIQLFLFLLWIFSTAAEFCILGLMSVSKKRWQSTVLYDYCELSPFFETDFIRVYYLKRCKALKVNCPSFKSNFSWKLKRKQKFKIQRHYQHSMTCWNDMMHTLVNILLTTSLFVVLKCPICSIVT